MTRIALNFLIIPILFASFIIFTFSATVVGLSIDRIDPNTFSHDERLQYIVTYLGIRIGTVEILNRYNNDNPGYVDESVITLRSFSGVPFLSVHTEFYSKRGVDGYFIESTTFDRQRNRWAYYSAYRKENESDVIVDRGYKNMNDGELYDVEIDTLFLDRPVNDALTFLTILRDSANAGNVFEKDVLIDRSVEKIRVDSHGETEEIAVRAFNNKTDAYLVTGAIEFTAIHGLSRQYTAWISSDEQRVPLKARVRISIGSIKIELEEYEHRKRHN